FNEKRNGRVRRETSCTHPAGLPGHASTWPLYRCVVWRMVRLRKRFICLLIFMSLVLGACRDGTAEVEATPAASATPTATVRPAATPTDRPTATPSPTPEPPAPVVEVSDQPLTESGTLV